MKYFNIFLTLIFLVVTAVFQSGCQGRIEEPARDCAGKETVEDAIEALSANTGIEGPVRGSGHTRLVFFDEDNQRHRENFQIRLWMEPPDHIYLQGEIVFSPRALLLGSNSEEFWFWVKPEISTYWWGQWDQVEHIQQLPVSPRVIFEAVGFAGLTEADEHENWSLHQQGPHDVLTLSRQGRVVKKVYIDKCDYTPERIEYFGKDRQLIAVTELDRYVQISDGVRVPAYIKIVTFGTGYQQPFEAEITLDSVEAATFTARQREYLFKRPSTRGFDNVYEIK